MRSILRYITLLLTICILATACQKDEHPGGENKTTPEQTLIFYLAGTHLNSYFSKNISDIESAVGNNILGNSRIVVFCQNGQKERGNLMEITYKDGQASSTLLTSYNLPVAMNESELGEIFADIIKRVPAKRYSLIIGSHARGWLPISTVMETSAARAKGIAVKDIWARPENSLTRFIGEQTNPANMFDISTLATAINSTGVKMEYILFDACLMSNIEAAYELRNSTKYVVASPCEILNDGFPYDIILPHMLQNGGRSYDLDKVCKTYNEFYNSTLGYSGSIATIDCSQLDGLVTAMKSVNGSAKREYKLSDIQSYEGQTEHIFYDLGDYVNTMCDNQQVRDAFNRQLALTVIHKYTLASFLSDYGNRGIYPVDINAYSGISTSAPSTIYRNEYKQTAWYKATN